MPSDTAEALTVTIDDERSVSALLQVPPNARALYVLAHGAGAGMRHPFLTAVSAGLADRGVATLRYQFHYMERGSRRPDPPKLAQAAVRAAVEEAARRMAGLPLIAGGKSFGGRMTSQAQAEAPLSHVRGLAFLGFPLHPPGKPSQDRAEHLSRVDVPMLFLQGTRDDFADLAELRPVVDPLGDRATLTLMDAADHSFHVPAKSGRKDADVRAELLDAFADWVDAAVAQRKP